MKVLNKVIVVTGASGGIGRELVLQLLEKGARVAAVINKLLNIKFSPSEPSPRSSDPPISVTERGIN